MTFLVIKLGFILIPSSNCKQKFPPLDRNSHKKTDSVGIGFSNSIYLRYPK